MILLYDNISDSQITFDATKRTADGYLAASARVARTGIQVYTGRECGRPDLELVRVYRPESEVFKADAIKTFAHRPITDDHPHKEVTADNWRQLSKGHTGEEVIRDGKFVRVPMLLMDGPTIKKWEDGKRELSMGYACDLVWEDGITPDGEEYDAIQRNIRANHLALVKKARGGEDLRIGDKEVDSAADGSTADDLDTGTGNTGETTMKIMVDGISLEMADKDAQIVQRALDAAKDELFKKKKEVEELEVEAEAKKKKYETDAATLTTQVATLTTENTQLKKQVADAAITPAKLDELVKQRSVTLDKAKAILGDGKVDVKMTDAEIRRACVNHVVGDAAKDWSDDLVNASFATIKTQPSDGVRKLANSFDHQLQPQNTTVLDTSYNKYEEDLRKASQAAAA